MDVFAKRLKEERLACGFTQGEFAERLGIPLGTYISYESLGTKKHRDPSFEMLIKIATLLNTTTDYLLGKDPI